MRVSDAAVTTALADAASTLRALMHHLRDTQHGGTHGYGPRLPVGTVPTTQATPAPPLVRHDRRDHRDGGRGRLRPPQRRRSARARV